MNEESRLGYLDGLRGFAALWVLTGHLLNAVTLHIPIISNATYAVDLFMLISGFLMYYHAQLRSKSEPLEKPSSWLIFWTRRFFRLAPAYYLALILAFFVGEYVLSWAYVIKDMPFSNTTTLKNFIPSLYNFSPENTFLHLSFLFGFSPTYHEESMLFDWSLGLEMQFYAAFPFIVLAFMAFGYMRVCVALVLLSMAAHIAFPDYMTSFWQPTFLLFKINMFLSGMMIAATYFLKDKSEMLSYILAAFVLALMPLAYSFGLGSSAFRVLFVALMLGLSLYPHLKIFTYANKFLSNKFCVFLSETSYAVYLIHPLCFIPVTGFVMVNFGGSLSQPILFLISFAITLPLTYGLGYAIYRLVEQPGILLGKKVTRALRRTPATAT